MLRLGYSEKKYGIPTVISFPEIVWKPDGLPSVYIMSYDFISSWLRRAQIF